MMSTAQGARGESFPSGALRASSFWPKIEPGISVGSAGASDRDWDEQAMVASPRGLILNLEKGK